MKKWKRWSQIKKGRLAALATGAVVIGTLAAVLINASGLHKMFEPRDFEHFENQYETSEEYDSAAGDGEKSDLADESDEGQDSADGDTQKALKVAEDTAQNPGRDGLGMADPKNQPQNPGDRNPDAFEISDRKDPDGIGVTKGNGGDAGNTGGSGRNPGGTGGNGQGGKKPGDGGTGTNSGNDGNGGHGGNTQNPENPDDPQKPDDPDSPDPPKKPDTWEEEQLKPRDPVETEDGVLVRLTASISREYFLGDVFEEKDAAVTATFRQKDNTDKTVALSYGGKNGYSVTLSTKLVGTYTAVFSYLGMTARAQYEVISSGLSIRYYSEKDGEIYATAFPGPLGDEETIDRLSSMSFHPVSGGIVDLTDLHSRMIAYLGDGGIRQNFLADTLHRNVVFLEEQDGYLTKMLCGFQYFMNGSLEAGGPYTYYPVYNWGSGSMRNVMDVVSDVPAGYRIRRTVQNEGNLDACRGSQILEQYTGNGTVLSVPAGVTEIALKGEQGNGNITSLQLPESVNKIDFKSISECLAKLNSYQVNGHSIYKTIDGVLYSADGKTLISVPPGKTSLSIPDTVTTIAAGAFRNSSIRELTVPGTVTGLLEGCFEDFHGDVIRIEGTAALAKASDTGYEGKILFEDSEYDAVLKTGMFAFGSRDIVFGAMDQEGREIPEKLGIYEYDGPRHILTLKEERQTLAGIPAETSGLYTVPDGITAVEEGAFATASGLREIVLPDTVTELRDGSLVLPDSVTDLYLSADLTRVSPVVFGGPAAGAAVPGITVYVPKEYYNACLAEWSAVLDGTYGADTAKRLLKEKDDRIFYENHAKYQRITEDGSGFRLLKVYAQDAVSFGVKEGTAEIAADAFSLCSSLEILSLPGSVELLPAGSLKDCQRLQTVASDRAGLITADAFGGSLGGVGIYEKGSRFDGFIYDQGVLYGRAADGVYTLIDVPSDYSGTMTLYQNTGALNEEAFKDCIFLTNVEIPDPEALTDIGVRCFDSCTALTSMRLDGAVNLQRVGDEAFHLCTGLNSLYLPGHLTGAGKGLCCGCTSLQIVRAAGITVLPEEMFYGCQSLLAGGLTLGWEKMTAVGNRAFVNCSLIGSVPDMPALESLGDQAFFGCQRLGQMVLPETLTSMGEECFGECSSLTQVTLGGRLTGISRYCFYGCRSLVRLDFSEQQKKELQVVGVQAFGQCASLESLDLSEFPALRQMGERTFEGDGFLTTVRLPENLEKIPDYCFYGCGNLSILSLNSTKVTEPGTEIFGDTLSPFIHIWVREESLPDYENAYKGILDPVYGEGTVQKILGKIEDKTEIIRGITYVITDEGRVLKEASEAFEGSYTVPVDTVRIAPEAFMDCTGLTEIVLQDDSRVSLGDRCFKGCTGLRTVQLGGVIPEWGEDTFAGCTGMERLLLGSGHGEQIGRIGTRAFKGCTGLAGRDSVSLRAAVRVLGEECFADCVNLEAIPTTATARESLEVIEDRAFAGCVSLSQFTSSVMSGLKTIGASAFYDCDSLVNPSVPAGVTSVGKGCFEACDSLLTVSFYCVLEEYPADCFKNCPKLTRTGGVAGALSGLRRIGESAYEGCTSLTTNASWNLGRYTGLEEIGANAFRGCGNMTEISLPATVKQIGAGAFDGLSGLKQILFASAQAPQIGRIAFDTLPADLCIRVPDSAADGDSVYKEYLAVFTEMPGSRAGEILDSLTDGAKDRNQPARIRGRDRKDDDAGENAGGDTEDTGKIRKEASGNPKTVPGTDQKADQEKNYVKGQGTDQEPEPGTDPAKGQGTDQGPGPGTDPAKGQGTDQGPGPGTDPAKGHETDQGPGQGTDPAKGHETDPETADADIRGNGEKETGAAKE